MCLLSIFTNSLLHSGQWEHNKKEGYGVFVFEDGHLYEGFFNNDKMGKATATSAKTSSGSRPPSTAASKQSNTGPASRQIQLYVDVLDLLPCAAADVGIEISRLEKLALQYNTELKRIYKKYCISSGAASTTPAEVERAQDSKGLANSFTMGVKDFIRFCQDCKMMGDIVSSTTVIDTILYKMRRHHFYQIESIIHRRQR